MPKSDVLGQFQAHNGSTTYFCRHRRSRRRRRRRPTLAHTFIIYSIKRKNVVLCRESNAGGEKGEEKQQEPDVVELYVDLMCQFRPQDVYNFIKMNEGYRLEEALQVSAVVSFLLLFLLAYT